MDFFFEFGFAGSWVEFDKRGGLALNFLEFFNFLLGGYFFQDFIFRDLLFFCVFLLFLQVNFHQILILCTLDALLTDCYF